MMIHYLGLSIIQVITIKSELPTRTFLFLFVQYGLFYYIVNLKLDETLYGSVPDFQHNL